ncbi:MAG TPA: hypothetical protein PKI11_08775 [Candidatus Hydrogenedentes bacterium]|nr:hypothetical protein [Candidatus Hydrogenedentota bacterium]
MELVDITQLRPGQTVAKAVINASGAVLCPPGFCLTEIAIERLRNAGITAVVIEGVEDKAPEIQNRLQALEERFEGIDDPILLQLKAAIKARLNMLHMHEV